MCLVRTKNIYMLMFNTVLYVYRIINTNEKIVCSVNTNNGTLHIDTSNGLIVLYYCFVGVINYN